MDDLKECDARFLSEPSEWPMEVACPVKKYQKGSDSICGIVLPNVSIVFQVNIFDPELTSEKLLTATQHRYNTMEELVADGWQVD